MKKLLIFLISLSFFNTFFANNNGVKIVLPQDIVKKFLSNVQIEGINSEKPSITKIDDQSKKESGDKNIFIKEFNDINKKLNNADNFLNESVKKTINFFTSKKHLFGLGGISYGYVYLKYINPLFIKNLVSNVSGKSIDLISTAFKSICNGILDAAFKKPGKLASISAASLAIATMFYGSRLFLSATKEFVIARAKAKGEKKLNQNNQ